jgi:DNA-binding transcriptional ArsR family regulator
MIANCCAGLEDLLVPRFFKALGDPTRVAILARLAQSCGPSTVGSVAGCCPVDLSVVSRHLRVLRDAGIVVAERRGKEVLYSVRYDALAQTLRQLADAIEACCPNPQAATPAEEARAK